MSTRKDSPRVEMKTACVFGTLSMKQTPYKLLRFCHAFGIKRKGVVASRNLAGCQFNLVGMDGSKWHSNKSLAYKCMSFLMLNFVYRLRITTTIQKFECRI